MANIVKPRRDPFTAQVTNDLLKDLGAIGPAGETIHADTVALSPNTGVDVGDVDVTSVVPGVAATNLGKAEDAQHTSGDVGVAVLAVRKDAVGTLAAHDNDYAPLLVDANGRLYVNPPVGQAAMAASAPVTVASDQTPVPVGANRVLVTQTPAITAGAYHAKDAVGGLLTFAASARVTGGTGVIEKVVVIDNAAQAAELVLVLFDQTFGATADNAAFDPTDADLANCVGTIPIYASDYATLNDNAVATKAPANFAFKCVAGGTSLFGQLYCTATPTYAAVSDIIVKLLIARD